MKNYFFHSLQMVGATQKSKKKTIEETYQKLDQRDHVLLRSGMYIGSVSKHLDECWIFDNSNLKMIKKIVEYSPGFMKIFDEVLTNCLDASSRDSTVNIIKVDYSQSSGYITIYNNGKGIPCVIHKEHNLYVPELIFGHLLSGSNYDDNQNRIGAGTFGVGSKTTNIFSKHMKIEIVDLENKKKYIQDFSENMSIISKPKITCNSSKGYVKISFLPDYSRFNMSGLDNDTISLINKRVYDCIAVSNSKMLVYLNGEKIKGKGLVDYTRYFIQDPDKIITESFVKDDFIWEYAIIPHSQYEHVSFVNGNCTIQGGKHVDYIMYQIVNKLKILLETKKKLKDVKPNFIKDKMFLFLRATVVNPQFNSQTKETLTTLSKDFGIKIEVSDAFINKIYKSSIVDDIVEFCKLKENIDLGRKTDGSKRNKVYIPNLEDAIYAGTSKSNECTLILTEGLSALTFAMWGRSVVGPNTWGAWPMKGKVLNIRQATSIQLLENIELNNIKQIMGLKHDHVYKDTSTLRYGKIMILTDSDHDGSHIKSLLINMVSALWPSLLKINPNFIMTLRTPIVKAVKGKKIIEFFTEQDYKKWSETNQTGYNVKYYKGLGTSTKADAKEIFSRINDLKIEYYYKDEKCLQSIILAFDKDKPGDLIKCTDKRKEWLANYNKDDYIQTKEHKVSYQDQINKELIHFSIYDNLRSIPSICDGFKPSQRKILHYMLKKNVTKDIKVAQLSGYISAETSYHHGEVSLQGTIINLSQDFVGSNNINLLVPEGNFGSRLGGGKDSASPRYIYTRLHDITPLVFNQHDLPLFNYLQDDGIQIEPEWFLPIIPMILVNGCSGIGTGYSTTIPSYNPKDIINNLKLLLQSKHNDTTILLDLLPFYRNFNGIIEKVDQHNFISKGTWKKISNTKIAITELPIGTWVTAYKEFLESFIEHGKVSKKSQPFILKDVQNNTTDENTNISFLVEFQSSHDLSKLLTHNTLETQFKLVKKINTNNMYLFNQHLKLTKYNTPNEILIEFYHLRLEFYEKRRQHIITVLTHDLCILSNKIRFIQEYISGTLLIAKVSEKDILKQLNERGFHSLDEQNPFDYLLSMSIKSLTLERITSLENQCNTKQKELEYYQTTPCSQLWLTDLENLEKKMNNA